MMAMFCDFNQHYTMYKQDRLDPEFWSSIEHNLSFYIHRPGVSHWWRTQPFALDDSFTQYINSLLSKAQTEEDNRNNP